MAGGLVIGLGLAMGYRPAGGAGGVLIAVFAPLATLLSQRK